MTDNERVILLNQSVILTALADILDKLKNKDLADECDKAAERTKEWIKYFVVVRGDYHDNERN